MAAHQPAAAKQTTRCCGLHACMACGWGDPITLTIKTSYAVLNVQGGYWGATGAGGCHHVVGYALK
jgi:hypothetical protein